VSVTSKILAGSVLTLALLALAACGRRGDLEPPGALASPAPSDKHHLDLRRPSTKITPPDGAFVLDPLLK